MIKLKVGQVWKYEASGNLYKIISLHHPENHNCVETLNLTSGGRDGWFRSRFVNTSTFKKDNWGSDIFHLSESSLVLEILSNYSADNEVDGQED